MYAHPCNIHRLQLASQRSATPWRTVVPRRLSIAICPGGTAAVGMARAKLSGKVDHLQQHASYILQHGHMVLCGGAEARMGIQRGTISSYGLERMHNFRVTHPRRTPYGTPCIMSKRYPMQHVYTIMVS